MHVKATKNRKWAGMLGGDQRGSCGGIRWKQGVRNAYLTQTSNGKAKKQTMTSKKSKIMGSTECKVIEKPGKMQTREMSIKKGGGKAKTSQNELFCPI